MGRNWLWFAGPAAATTSLFIAVAAFSGADSGQSSPSAVVTTTTRAQTVPRNPGTTRRRTQPAATTTRETTTTRQTTTTRAPTTTTQAQTTTIRPPTTTTQAQTTTARETTTTSGTTTRDQATTTRETTTAAATTTSRPATTTTTPTSVPTRTETTTRQRTTTRRQAPTTTTKPRTTRPARATPRRRKARVRTVNLARVPELRGLLRDEAIAELREAGFRPKLRQERSFQPDGTVLNQWPRPNARIKRGRNVLVTVAFFKVRTPPEQTPAPPAVSTVPRVVGLDYSEAAARIELLGITANSYPVRSRRPLTIVVQQTPRPGSRVQRGSSIRLVVSRGRTALPPYRVPATFGLREVKAHERCRDANFTCRTVFVPAGEPDEVGRVVRQTPSAGQVARALTQMKLFVAR
jgi:beta-lactam-binding protein with PASTA domain